MSLLKLSDRAWIETSGIRTVTFSETMDGVCAHVTQENGGSETFPVEESAVLKEWLRKEDLGNHIRGTWYGVPMTRAMLANDDLKQRIANGEYTADDFWEGKETE